MLPLLAVAEELRRRGHQVLFFGTKKGIEARLVPARGFPIEYVEIGGLKGVGLQRTLRTLWNLPISTLRIRTRMRSLQPRAVFSLGGYVAGPTVLAALLRRVPVIAMEPNAVPGITTHYRVTPVRNGSYAVVCAELCGLGHSTMRSTVHVVDPGTFKGWLAAKRAAKPAGATS